MSKVARVLCLLYDEAMRKDLKGMKHILGEEKFDAVLNAPLVLIEFPTAAARAAGAARRQMDDDDDNGEEESNEHKAMTSVGEVTLNNSSNAENKNAPQPDADGW